MAGNRSVICTSTALELPPVLPVFNFRFRIVGIIVIIVIVIVIIVIIIIIVIVIIIVIIVIMSARPTSPSSHLSLSQDPYCGWNIVSSKCVSHNTFNSM